MASQINGLPLSESFLDSEAAGFVRTVGRSHSKKVRSEFFSLSIYDTSWVSMVAKLEGDQRRWLFPESFVTLLAHQSDQGGWEQGVSDIDGILNTMAALLAMLWHQKSPLDDKHFDSTPDQLSRQISSAIGWLGMKLKSWDIEASDQVGFEILIPSLLRLLERECIQFQFPASRRLEQLNASKLSEFKAHKLYSDKRSTLVHSLEAFVGIIEFDKVGHHLSDGSMMASPSSTAAYLIHSTKWDDAAEQYLRRVLSDSVGGDQGGFPSAFPSTIFEASWVLSVLLQAGYSLGSLDPHSADQLSTLLESALNEGGGIVGFAPDILADADDTAKAILALNLMGKPVNVERMVSEFDNGLYFQTYVGERTSSFSANCNVLHTLLHVQTEQYQVQITKAAEYICSAWAAGKPKDKWNTSVHYSMMLCAQSLGRLLQQWDSLKLPTTTEEMLYKRIPLVLTQILGRTMQMQETDGSWEHGSCEVTAFAVLTLVSLVALPWIANLRESHVALAIEKGKDYLRENHYRWNDAHYIWVEKVTYASKVLSQAYCLAAMKASPSEYAWSQNTQDLTRLPTKSITKLEKFFSSLPLFSKIPNHEIMILMSLSESYFSLPQLRCSIPAIFPRNDEAESKYLEYIPFTWISCSNLAAQADSAILMDMMVISVLNYQVDQYMEAVIARDYATDFQPIRDLISTLGKEERDYDAIALKRPGTDTLREPSRDPGRILSDFVDYVTGHPATLRQSSTMRQHLLHSLRTFLHAQLTQLSDNARLASFGAPSIPYHEWVHTTSAAHTSCHYSFLFFCCLINLTPGQWEKEECFTTVRQKYLALDVCAHLATMCRMYNDVGSVARDREENNVNSVDFPEFDTDANCNGLSEDKKDEEQQNWERQGEDKKKADLLWLAAYERECLEQAFAKLEESGVTSRTRDMLRLFVRVTDLYGQIYVARDLTARIK